MKNLLDEIHKLDEEEFEVSYDFSKKVISKINKNNKIIILKRVTSVTAVACFTVFAVVLSNKLGFLDRMKNLTNKSEDNMNVSISSTTNNQMIEETVEQDENIYDMSSLKMAVDEKSDEFDYLAADEIPYENAEEESAKGAASDKTRETTSQNEAFMAKQANRTYSKQMNLKDYINDIHEALNNKKIENNIISDTEIEILTDDVNLVYDVIENYTDAKLNLMEDKILLVIE